MNTTDHDVHTDPEALANLTDATEHEPIEVAPDGSVVGYKARRTLRLRVELVRQLRRRRVQFLLGFLVLLPFILWAAFEFGDDGGGQGGSGFVDEGPVPRHYRDAKYLEIGGGSNEVQRIVIGRSMGLM